MAKRVYEYEETPPENTVTATQDGPLYVVGDLEIQTSDGPVRETRAALCRCGASRNKPYCDNSHLEIGFEDTGALGEGRLVPDEELASASVAFTVAPNGPLLIRGTLTVRSADGGSTCTGTRGALCRCGASQKKPYCDGTHKTLESEEEWGR